MKFLSRLLLFLSLFVTSVALAEQLTGMPVVSDPASPSPRDTIATLYIDTTLDPAQDTLYIAVQGVVVKTVAVNAYVRVINAIDLPMKPVYHVGYWSAVIMSGKRSAPELTDAGVWRKITSVPRKPGTIFTVVTRDGSRRDLQPVDP